MVQLDELDAVPSNVKVVVRVRPENEREQAAVRSHIVQVMDEHVLVFDPKEESSPNYYRGKRRRGRDLMKRKNRDLKFAFDRVFDQNETNNDVFEDTTKSLLEGVLNGYNCSVFAYGATGAGKTHTMLGNPNQPGVIFLTMMKLYEVIDQMKEDKTIDVAVSYLEVYNEKIKDLLLPSEYLPVREDPQKGVVVAGLSLHKPKSAEELMHMLDFGNRNRTQHPTDANAESSRSHAVFQVFVRQKDRTANISADVKVGKMSLIDLAGSERATVTKNRGQRLREGANINRSLLALGNCINALADSKYKGHVPYRNSKLTRLLKDSLGGNCRTVMIAAVSPSALSSEDTYNTLRYADRAKHIKAKLKKNVMSVDFHVSRYAQIVEELRAEVCQLKSKLHGYESGTVVSGGIVHVDQNEEVDRLLHSMRSVFSARVSIHKEIMDFECSQRDLEFRIYRKERTLSRLNSINLDPVTHEQITSKIQRQITAAQTRRCTLANKTMSGNERLDENNQWLDRVKSEINLAVEGGHTPEVVEVSMQAGHLEVELRDTRRQVKHLKKLVKAQDRETQTSEKLICGLIGLVRKQYFLLKGCNLATSDMTAEFESVQSAVINDREISWADQSFSESGESTVLRLIDLPVLSCAATPKTPSRKRRRSTVSRTPRTPGRKSFLAANNTMTPRRSTGKPKNNLGFTPSASPASSLTENSSSLRVTGQGSGESPNVIQECIENRIQAGVTPAPKTLDFGSHSDEEKSESDAETRTSHSVDSSAGDIGKFLRVEKSKQYPDTRKEMSLSPSCSDTSCPNSCPSDTTLIMSSSDQEQSSGRRSLDETFTLPVGQDHLGLPMPMVSSSVESAEDESSSIPECIRSEACQGQGQGEVQLRLCGSSTVTKSKTIGDSRETGASRSITFNSPTGIRSFADAVRSPPSSNILLSGYNSRSPLAVELEQSPAGEPAIRRERKVDFIRNLANTKSTVGKNGSRGRGPAGFKPDRLKMIGQEHGDGGNGRVTSSPLRELNTGNPTLQRMGLPSMQRKCPTPKYMKLTAAAANKRRNNHNRSLSSKENTREVLSSQTLNSRRLSVYHDENGRPAGERRKNLAKSRSQSCRNITASESSTMGSPLPLPVQVRCAGKALRKVPRKAAHPRKPTCPRKAISFDSVLGSPLPLPKPDSTLQLRKPKRGSVISLLQKTPKNMPSTKRLAPWANFPKKLNIFNISTS